MAFAHKFPPNLYIYTHSDHDGISSGGKGGYGPGPFPWSDGGAGGAGGGGGERGGGDSKGNGEYRCGHGFDSTKYVGGSWMLVRVGGSVRSLSPPTNHTRPPQTKRAARHIQNSC